MPIRQLCLVSLLPLLAACATTSGPPLHPGQHYWDELEPGRVSNTVPAAEQRLADLFAGELTAERCARHRDGLEHALGRIPVDLVGVHTARDCAALLGDGDWQRRAQIQLDALIDYALNNGRGSHQWNPAPILEAYDVGVIAEARGLSVNWLRYLGITGGRYWLLEASMTDRVTGRERQYYFDLMAAMRRLYLDDPTNDFPTTRRAMAHMRLEADALAGDPLALTGYLYMDVETGETNPAAARRALEQAWESGVPAAAMMLAALCLSESEAGCDAGALEAYSDGLSELNIGEGWAMRAALLALNEDQGPGDPEFDAALKNAGERAASARMSTYVAALLQTSTRPPSPKRERTIETLLQRAGADGSADAWLMRFQRLPSERRNAADSDAVAWLTAAADAGHPRGHYLLARLKGLDSESGFDHLRAAFRKGLPEAALLMSLLVPEEALRIELLRRAAFGGDGDAAMLLGMYALDDSDDPDHVERAREWLVSGTLFGHLESTARLAALFWTHPELDPNHEDAALELVQALYREAGAEAALRVAALFSDAPPFNQSPNKGVELLRRMSDMNIAEASLRLADRARYGEGMDRDLAAAAQWYQRAERQGASNALYRNAGMQAFDLGDPRTALAMFQRAADTGHVFAANDYAWFLCTGQAGAARDPLRGLAEIETLLKHVDKPHPYLVSTLAACQAALGDFESARDNHRRALDRALTELPDETEAHQSMRDRLALYEAEQAYIWRP